MATRCEVASMKAHYVTAALILARFFDAFVASSKAIPQVCSVAGLQAISVTAPLHAS